MAAAAQLQPLTIRSIRDEIISTYDDEYAVDHYLERFHEYVNFDMDNYVGRPGYVSNFQYDTPLVTYNDQEQPEFFHVNDEPYILRLIYDMVDDKGGILNMQSLQHNADTFLEKYKLKDAYDAYKVIFNKKMNALVSNGTQSVRQETINNVAEAASSANGGRRRSKRSHRKTQKGKSRKHRSKGGRRGKSRKH